MQYTTIKQSKKLLELGLSPETADMYYYKDDGNKYITTPVIPLNKFISKDFYDCGNIPCWSVGALLDVIPPKIYGPIPKDHPTELIIGKPKEFVSVCYFDWTGLQHGPEFTADTYVDAIYHATVWLLENNYINKGND